MGDSSFVPDIGSELQSLLKEENEDAMTRAFGFILRQAVNQRASDIHLEPLSADFRVRFRIDGILHDIAAVPSVFQQRLVSHIKVLANLVIYRRDLPQDGSL